MTKLQRRIFDVASAAIETPEALPSQLARASALPANWTLNWKNSWQMRNSHLRKVDSFVIISLDEET